MKIRPWKRQTANLFDTWECVIMDDRYRFLNVKENEMHIKERTE